MTYCGPARRIVGTQIHGPGNSGGSAISPVTRYAAAVALGGLFLAGCTGGTAAGKPADPVASGTAGIGHAVAGGEAVIDSFTATLQPRAARSFEAEYNNAGRGAPGVVYAVRPPDGLLFKVIPLARGKSRFQVVMNGSGEYSCTSPGTGPARWTCRQMSKAVVAAQNRVVTLYGAARWAAFLKAFARAPGFARYHVHTFITMGHPIPGVRRSPVGTGWRCLDFSPPGTQGIDVICTAAPGILGLVTYRAISFIMGSYTTSPSASLFDLPPGAKIIKLETGAG